MAYQFNALKASSREKFFAEGFIYLDVTPCVIQGMGSQSNLGKIGA